MLESAVMEPSGRGSRDRWAYLAIPLAVVVFHVATARGYGIFRDELYYLGDDRGTLETIFESVERAATFDCDLCMPYEDDNPIWVCRRMKTDPRELWPRVKHYI